MYFGGGGEGKEGKGGKGIPFFAQLIDYRLSWSNAALISTWRTYKYSRKRFKSQVTHESQVIRQYNFTRNISLLD